jgi:8-oxo-dGTP pyrophosphatase MutT (NUDIX family)
MEEKDFLDFEKCALREFKEETGLDISSCHEKLSREKFKRGYFGPGICVPSVRNFWKEKSYDHYRSV